LVLCILEFLRLLFVLKFYFIIVPCSVALSFALIFQSFVSGICDSASLDDHNLVAGYLLFPSKFVLYFAFWCVYLWLFSDYSFSHFLTIVGDYLLIAVDVLWHCGEYVDELNFSTSLRRIS